MGEFHAVGGTFHDVISVEFFNQRLIFLTSRPFDIYVKYCVPITCLTLPFNTCNISTEVNCD